MESKIFFKELNEKSVSVICDNILAGTISAQIIRPANMCPSLPCRPISIDSGLEGACLGFISSDGDVNIRLELKAHKTGLVGKLKASGKGHVIVRIIWKLPEEERGFPFMPAFMYGCNDAGECKWAAYPQLYNGNNGDRGPWVSKEWLVRTDRSSHGVTSVIMDSRVYAMGGRDVCFYVDGTVAEKTGLGISSDIGQPISFSLGFINSPFTYSSRPGRNYPTRPEGYVNLDKGEVQSEFHILSFSHSSRCDGAGKVLRESYELVHDGINTDVNIEEAVKSIGDCLVEYGYCPEARHFYVEFADANKKSNELFIPRFVNGWAGGQQVAFPLLLAGHLTGNKQWQECARTVISNIAENAISEKTGLYNENYDINKNEWNAKGWWYWLLEKRGHSGYVNGTMCYYTLRSWLTEKEAGITHESWLNSAKRVLDRAAETQGEDGCFGYVYSEEDGSILDDDGFSGCWFISAFATLYSINKEEKYLDIARRAMDYYRRHVEAFNAYAGPHDIFKSPDEEGILGWIEASRIMHGITGEERFLKDLLMGLDYEFSWKFAYNVVNEIEPLKSMRWCSTGGSVTSVNNAHIHPMGSAVAGCILYAAKVTGDQYLWSRLKDTVRWTLTIYLKHDGYFGFGKKGMVSERFCYSDTLLLERFPDGSPSSVWFCAHSWASGSALCGLVDGVLEAWRKDGGLITGA